MSQPAVMDGRLFRTDRTRYCRVVAPIAVCCSMLECMEPLAGMIGRGGVEDHAGAVRGPNASKLQQHRAHTLAHIMRMPYKGCGMCACMPRPVTRVVGRVVSVRVRTFRPCVAQRKKSPWCPNIYHARMQPTMGKRLPAAELGSSLWGSMVSLMALAAMHVQKATSW